MNTDELVEGPFSFAEDEYRYIKCDHGDEYLTELGEHIKSVKDCGCKFNTEHNENCGLYNAYIYDKVNRMHISIGGPRFIIERAVNNLNRTFQEVEKRNKSKIRCAIVLTAGACAIFFELILPTILKLL